MASYGVRILEQAQKCFDEFVESECNGISGAKAFCASREAKKYTIGIVEKSDINTNIARCNSPEEVESYLKGLMQVLRSETDYKVNILRPIKLKLLSQDVKDLHDVATKFGRKAIAPEWTDDLIYHYLWCVAKKAGIEERLFKGGLEENVFLRGEMIRYNEFAILLTVNHFNMPRAQAEEEFPLLIRSIESSEGTRRAI